MIGRIVALEGIAEVPVTSDNIVVAGRPTLLWLCRLHAEYAPSHLRWLVDTAGHTAEIDARPLELKASLNCSPGNGTPVLLQETGAASEGGQPDCVALVVQERLPMILKPVLSPLRRRLTVLIVSRLEGTLSQGLGDVKVRGRWTLTGRRD